MIKKFMVILFLFFSCATKDNDQSKYDSKPKGPSSATNMFVLEIRAVELNNEDFNLNSLGAPHPVVFRLFENNRLIWKEVLGRLRGKHAFRHNDATKVISFNEKSAYRIVIKNDGLITFPDTWGGGEWGEGIWPFDQLKDNKLYKGTSWVEVMCHPLLNMDYRKNMEILDF